MLVIIFEQVIQLCRYAWRLRFVHSFDPLVSPLHLFRSLSPTLFLVVLVTSLELQWSSPYRCAQFFAKLFQSARSGCEVEFFLGFPDLLMTLVSRLCLVIDRKFHVFGIIEDSFVYFFSE